MKKYNIWGWTKWEIYKENVPQIFEMTNGWGQLIDKYNVNVDIYVKEHKNGLKKYKKIQKTFENI